MAKKQLSKSKEQKDEKTIKSRPTNSTTSRKITQNKKNLQSIAQLPVRMSRSKSLQIKNQKSILKTPVQNIKPQPQQQPQSKLDIPAKSKRKISKKKKAKQVQQDLGKKQGVKLQRGYKFCQNCQTILNIHKYVCTQCGFVHNMKKHKLDVMKNLSKGTPKIVKSIIESNEFNCIKINGKRSLLHPSSLCGNDEKQLMSQDIEKDRLQKIGGEQDLKDNKYQRMGSKNNSRPQMKQANQVIEFHQKQQSKTQGGKILSRVSFAHLPIRKSIDVSSNVEGEEEESKFNNTREQFSIYKSDHPIICLQQIEVQVAQKQGRNHLRQFLLFTESISKKEFFRPDYELQNQVVYIKQKDQNNMETEKERKQSLKRKEEKMKLQELKLKLKKMRENNGLTEKALGLGNFHKVGALYEGQTIINLMSLNGIKKKKPKTTDQTPTDKLKVGIEQQVKEKRQTLGQPLMRRSSARSSKNKSKQPTVLSPIQQQKKIPQDKNVQREETKNEQNCSKEEGNEIEEYDTMRICVKQHVEMIRTIRNKVAILTGRKSILLMNLNLDWQNLKYGQSIESDGIIRLDPRDFSHQNNNFSLNQQSHLLPATNQYLTTISLSTSRTQEDQFTVIEWLKFYDSSNVNTNKESQKNPSFLVTGTLYGHIIIYKVTSQNHFSTYRTIVGAHFENINCIKECPLNNNGNAIFASASYDGSVKIWSLQNHSPISQFQVSNRKVQSIHWDSGAKFLLIVRDQGLENCYLACFYSVNNRVELPLTLTDSIDFRLIRNGLLFDNSCSPLIAFPLNSKVVVMVNARNGFLKILQSEELRKTSLKRKKSKKNYQQEIYHDYWMRFNMGKQLQNIIPNSQSKQITLLNLPSYSPQIIQMQSNVNAAAFAKMGFPSIPQEDEDENEDKNISYPLINEGINEDSQPEDQDLKFQLKSIHNKPQLQPQSKIKSSIIAPQLKSQPVEPIRKSLRVKKPNVHYNYMEDQENQDQLNIDNKNKSKLSSNTNNKKKISSDQEDFFDEEEDTPEQNEDGSDESFDDRKHKKLTDKIDPNHQQIKYKDIHSKSHSKTGRQTHKRKQIKKNPIQNLRSKILRSSRNSDKKINEQTAEAQDLLYKLFWQQTKQQSLAVKKQEYPSNKFPKFSAIASFLTVSPNQEKIIQMNLMNKEDQRKMEYKNQNKTKKEQYEIKKNTRNRVKFSHKQEQKLIENGSSFSNQQSHSSPNVQNSEEFNSDSQSNKSQSQYQNEKLLKNSREDSVRKISQAQKQQPDQKTESQSQFVITFIAGYNGELIKVKIRVQ